MSDEKRLFSPVSTEELVSGWLIHAHKARDRHDLASRTYARGQYMLGIPSLIASTIVGTSVFSALSSSEAPPLWVGLLSILAAALAAIQTFMDYGGRSDKHRLAGVRYKEIIRRMEFMIVKMSQDQGQSIEDSTIMEIQEKFDTLEEASPVVMPSIFDRVEKKYMNVDFVKNALELYR